MARFKWDIKEMKYHNMEVEDLKKIAFGGEYSLQEMQDAYDEYSVSRWKWSEIWRVFNLFESEKNTIKTKGTNWDGSLIYNTNSLKAWCKKNNVLIDAYGHCGLYSFPNYCLVRAINTTKEEIEKSIPITFFNLLKALKSKEYAYFLEHDEYSIKLTKINENIDNNLPMPFKSDISYYIQPFKGKIIKRDESGDSTKTIERKLTMEELDKIIIFQNAVASAIKNVIDTQSPNIDI